MSLIATPEERAVILNSLSSGMVPRIGLKHLQVGRSDEVRAMLKDLELIKSGSATLRIVIGRYGCGKSFFLNLSRTAALERRFVVLHADITLDHRLHGNGGQARALYARLMQNLAIEEKPNGGALAYLMDRWIADRRNEIHAAKGNDGDLVLDIRDRLKSLREAPGGTDFLTVILKYVEGYVNRNDDLQAVALRWLRGDYGNKTEARQDLGVRSIIDDSTYYDSLKLLGEFAHLAGYAGLFVAIDEMGIISHRLNHAGARNSNYEMILRIVNDCHTGARWIGFVLAGVDGFLDDNRRGMVSYEALRRRFGTTPPSMSSVKDLSGPVIRLNNLSPEELFVLLRKIRNMVADGDASANLLPDEGIEVFMRHSAKTLGAQFFQTPSEVIRPFVSTLMVLKDNPGVDWRALIAKAKIEAPPQADSSATASAGDDDISTIRL